jgi:RNA polymerase sigma-70 factor (family 1)
LQSTIFYTFIPVFVLPSDNEKELLCRIAAGDEAAFGELFHAYHQRLGAYICRLTESLPAAQEIVQDVFLKIWMKRAMLPEIQCFDAYLFKAARNHVYNYLRKIARERTQQAMLEASVATGEPVEELQAGEQEEYLNLLEAAITQLPRQQQKVYLLHRREGLSHAEIALRLQLSVETVKKHMSLALRSIRDYLSVGRLTG